MRSLRAALYPLRLVGARLGRRSAPVVLVVLGIAAGAAVVIGGRAGALVAQDRAVTQAVERIPDGQRSVRAVWFGLPGLGEELYPKLDERAHHALATVAVARPTPLVLFRETTVAGTFAGLGGVENLGRWVTLRSGRLPRAPYQASRRRVASRSGRSVIAASSAKAKSRAAASPPTTPSRRPAARVVACASRSSSTGASRSNENEPDCSSERAVATWAARSSIAQSRGAPAWSGDTQA